MERTQARLTRAELTEEVHQVIGLPLNESDIVACTILDSIVRALATRWRFGDSAPSTRDSGVVARDAIQTGARVEVPPKRIPFFKASKELRELVEKA